MLMPSIFGEDLFDNFMKDFPFFDDNAESNVEKKLYGRRGKNLMKTDIKETEGGYELEMDLPGFTKDEIKVSLENGYMTISAAKGLDKDEQDKKSGRYIRNCLLYTSYINRNNHSFISGRTRIMSGVFSQLKNPFK